MTRVLIVIWKTLNDGKERQSLRRHYVGSSRVRYRLQIVCQESSIVRDGIDIDACARVESMEIGEVTDAYD